MQVGRPREPRLSRELIVDAAMRQIDSGAPLSLNKIAKEFGVHISSLTHHVGDRGNLIELVRGSLAQRYPVVYSEDATWQEAIQVTARAIHQAFVDHPHLIPHMAHQGISSPEVLGTYLRLADVLQTAGFSTSRASLVIRFLDIITLGSGLEAAEKSFVLPPSDAGVEGDTGGESAARASTPRDEDAQQSDEAFELALRLYIEGLEREL